MRNLLYIINYGQLLLLDDFPYCVQVSHQQQEAWIVHEDRE